MDYVKKVDDMDDDFYIPNFLWLASNGYIDSVPLHPSHYKHQDYRLNKMAHLHARIYYNANYILYVEDKNNVTNNNDVIDDFKGDDDEYKNNNNEEDNNNNYERNNK